MSEFACLVRSLLLLPLYLTSFGNPSSLFSYAREAFRNRANLLIPLSDQDVAMDGGSVFCLQDNSNGEGEKRMKIGVHHRQRVTKE